MSQNNLHALWKNINSILKNTPQNDYYPKKVDFEGIELISRDVNALNSHFATVGEKVTAPLGENS